MAKPRKKRERKSTEVRQAEIVEAAMGVLATRGAKRFTAQLVAEEVGVTPGALFRHFGSMEAIVEAVIHRMEEVLFQGFPPAAEDPWNRLQAFFEHRIRVLSEHPNISRILLSEHFTHLGSKRPTARIRELKQRSRVFVNQCLQDAADDGLMAVDVTVQAAAVLVTGAILSLGHEAARMERSSDHVTLGADVWRAVERLRRP